MNTIKMFAGTSNLNLATKIANILKTDLGKLDVSKFNDGEIRVELRESVRNDDVFVFQSTSTPVNDNLMELLLIIDALKRSSARRITAVIPYYGYSRQDRRPGYSRVPITGRLVADMLESTGVDYVLTVDIHSLQQQGFFKIPMTSISASVAIVAEIWKRHYDRDSNLTIVSPDVGGVARARSIAKSFPKSTLAIVDKRRSPDGLAEVMNLIGDVEGKDCVIVDDMIDTAGTLCKAAQSLKDKGAKTVTACATHPVFSGNAYENIENSVIDHIIVTDTIPLQHNLKNIQQISIASVIAETIRRVHVGKSVSDIYMDD